MSQPPPPIPPPPYAPPPPPPPVMAAPTPVWALPMIARPSRPGIITALGVLSIVVAGLGMLGGVASAINLIRFSVTATMAGMFAAGPTLPAPTTAPVNTGYNTTATILPPKPPPSAPLAPRGLPPQERAEAARGLSELRFISAPRLEQLDALLAKSGRDIFPTRGEALTADSMEERLEFWGGGLSADPGKPGPDTFRTKDGRFELYDERAVFYPNRGEIVRVSTLTTSNPGLTPAQVEAVVQQAQVATGNSMNAPQLAALRTQLTAPGQQLVSPITLPTAVRSATLEADGSVAIQFPANGMSIGPRGQVSVAPGMVSAGGFRTMRPAINGSMMATGMIASLAGVALAIYLLIVGIFILRQSPHGRKMLVIYALIKIPLTIGAALVVWHLTNKYIDALTISVGVEEASDMISQHVDTFEVVLALLALIFPVAALIVLQTKAVKEYYATMLR